MTNDMVLDKNGNPAFCDSPAKTKKWLEYRLNGSPEMRTTHKVRVGRTMRTVTVPQYLGERKS